MEMTEYEEMGVTVFKVTGRVDSDGVSVLRDTLQRAMKEGKHKMVLEMSGLDYINSAGLRILAEVVTENKENGGDLRLVGLNDKVRRVFEIIGFVKFFRIYETVVGAMEGY